VEATARAPTMEATATTVATAAAAVSATTAASHRRGRERERQRKRRHANQFEIRHYFLLFLESERQAILVVPNDASR
jgi:hypothetical protein